MEKKYIKKGIFLLNVLFLIILFFQLDLTNGYSLEVVWKENFDDGDFDGWTLSTIHSNDGGWYNDTETGCEIVNGQLHFTSKGMPWHCLKEIPPHNWTNWYNYTRLWRSTTVANGSWSWDMYFGSEPCGVAFVGKTEVNTNSPINHVSFRYGYRVSIIPFSYNPADYSSLFDDNLFGLSVTGLPFICLVKYTSTWGGTILGLYESASILNNSWYHINVTRNYNSLKLYLDGVLRINVTDSSPQESTYWDLSKDEFFFQLGSHGGTRVDNITVVGDEIVPPDSTTTTTTTTTTTDDSTFTDDSTTTDDSTFGFGFGVLVIFLCLGGMYTRRRYR